VRPLYFFHARARVHTRGQEGMYARVFSELANKLVCGGLPHWESFVINLLSGIARTLYIPPRKWKRGEFLTCPDYFCDFWLENPERYTQRGIYIQYGISQDISNSVLEFSRHCCTPKENVFTISHNPSVDLEYSCGKLATNFYDTLRGLTTDFASNDSSTL